MSSILKALRKLEDDKSARKPDELKIDAEILRSDNSPRFSSAGIISVAFLLLAGGSGATYMYMKQDRLPEPARSIQTSMSREKQTAIPPASDIKTEQLPAAIVVVPATGQKTAQAEPPAQHQVAKTTAELPAKPSKSATPVVVSRPVEISKASRASTPPLTSSANSVPLLRVNGIAFQNSNADSMAIVNGIAVSKGSIVEGITVEEVQKDRVLFQRNGEKFEIRLGQSNR